MAKKEKKIIDCAKCVYNSEKCLHESNKGIIIKYRVRKECLLKTPDEINKKGNCKNYVELPEK